MKQILLFVLVGMASLIFPRPLAAQEQQAYKIGLIGFYNLENLFDTIDDPLKNDEEFLPNGANQWNTEKYLNKPPSAWIILPTA